MAAPAKALGEHRAKVVASLPVVRPHAQTEPVASSADAADDVAIWRNEKNPASSLLLGADKRFGLRVYTLEGKEVQTIAAGRINNIDLRALKGHPTISALAAASNRSRRSVSFFAVGHDGRVRWLQSEGIDTGLDDPYGLCMLHSAGVLSVFVNDRDGRFQQWRLRVSGELVHSQLMDEFTLEDQPEGCAGDDHYGRVFFGVEDLGVMRLREDAERAPHYEQIAAVDGQRLVADVEGMDIYAEEDAGYLVVSSQGNSSYAVFERLPPHRYRGSFRIGDNLSSGVDAVSDTDGLAVHARALGATFPRGVLVVQDGFNTAPRANQNFKIVDWREVEMALGL